MPVLCIGPVCIPLNLLLPFLLGVAHHYGWLRWVKREWVTWSYWKQRLAGQPATDPVTGGKAAGGAEVAGSIAADSTTHQPTGSQYVCEGGVCRWVPTSKTAAPTAGIQGSSSGMQQADSTAPAVSNGNSTPVAADSAVRQRKGGNSLVGMRAVDL